MQTQVETKSRFSAKSIGPLLRDNIIIVGIILIAIAVGIARPNFISEANFRNLLSNTAVRFIIAVGVSGCLITKGTDLSAGRVAGLAACLSAILLQKGDYAQKFYPNLAELPILVVLLIVLAICAIIGAINGSIIAFFKVPPFIATLGMMKICRSVTQQCMQKASPTVPKAFLKIANARIGGEIILPILYWLALAAILHVVSKHTAFGRQVFAIGSNERTSKLSGVNVRAVKRRVYALMGALVAITAVIQIARIGSMDYANAGSGYEMDAIAAVIIGGTSMSGGRGSVVGSVLGMLILAVMNNLLNLIGVPPFLREAFKGIIVIGAVLLQKKEKAS